MLIVRAKLFAPGDDNFGTNWQSVPVSDDGVGHAVFIAHRPARWTKFRVATANNDRIIQENAIRPLDDARPWDGAIGIEVDAGDKVEVDFVVHELAFKVRVNDEFDEEDQLVLDLVKLHRRVNKTD